MQSFVCYIEFAILRAYSSIEILCQFDEANGPLGYSPQEVIWGACVVCGEACWRSIQGYTIEPAVH